MKKILLLSFILLSFYAVSKADYTDYYRIYYQGKEIHNGDKIYCDETNYQGLDKNKNPNYWLDAAINLVSQAPDAMLFASKLYYTDDPTKEEWEKDPAKWGEVNICYSGGGPDGTIGSCFTMTGAIDVLGNGFDGFYWEVKLQYAPDKSESVYRFVMYAAEGELAWNNYEVIEDSECEIYIAFSVKAESGVEKIPVDNENTPEYFNLQGMRVKEPGKGKLMFVKRNGKVTKEIGR